MLDAKLLRTDTKAVQAALKRRHFVLDVERVGLLTEAVLRLKQQVESLQHHRNKESQAIGKAQGNGEDTTAMKAAMVKIGDQISALRAELAAAETALQEFSLSIPNLPDASVPQGSQEQDNLVLRTSGEPTSFAFKAQDHVALGEKHGLLDFAAASRIAGSRFVVLKGALARMHNALAQFMLAVHTQEHGYEELYVPFIANADALVGTGQLPKFAEDQFRLAGAQEQYLIATGEISATNMVRDSILDAELLPLRWVTHTPCFRKEAGSYGKDIRGMIRQHQFEKVELVQIVRPGASWQCLEELTGHAARILQLLELPYRVVSLCTGDLGFAAAKTHDLEVWLPGQDAYREISSCSNFLDFQARRMRARWRNPKTGKPEMVHTLNGSALAVGRTLVAVMENYQDKQGRILVPEQLAPWMAGIEVIE